MIDANHTPTDEYSILDDLTEANAARIVACVNALAGIEDPAAFVDHAKRVLSGELVTIETIEAYVQLRESHGRLVAALELVIRRWTFGNNQNHTHNWHDMVDTTSIARDALAAIPPELREPK